MPDLAQLRMSCISHGRRSSSQCCGMQFTVVLSEQKCFQNMIAYMYAKLARGFHAVLTCGLPGEIWAKHLDGSACGPRGSHDPCAILGNSSVVTWSQSAGCGGSRSAAQDQLFASASDSGCCCCCSCCHHWRWMCGNLGKADHVSDSCAVQDQLRNVQQTQSSQLRARSSDVRPPSLGKSCQDAGYERADFCAPQVYINRAKTDLKGPDFGPAKFQKILPPCRT